MNKNQRGAALWMTVLVTLVILTFFVGSVLSSAKGQTGLVSDELGEMQAHYAAMGAINKAFIFLEENPEWEGSWALEPLPQNPDVMHSLESDRSYSGIGPSEIYLKAQGFTRQYGPGTPLAAVAGTAYRPSGGLQNGFFAGRTLELENCRVDAYDATLGIGYLPQPSPPPDPPPPPPPQGTPPSFSGVPGGASVGANRELNLRDTFIDNKIVLPQAGLVLNGGISRGQGAELNSSGSTFSVTDKPKNRIDLPAISVPFDSGPPVAVIDSTNWTNLAENPDEPGGRILPPGAYRSVSVPDGGKLAFAPGEYYFDDGFYAISSGTRIKLGFTQENELTKLFVGGAFRLQGVDFRPVVSGDPDASPPVLPPPVIAEPAALRVYGAGLGDSPYEEKICNVALQDTNFSGLILGEAVEGDFHDSEIYGAVIGREIRASNVQLHYDTSLATIKLAEHARWKLRGLTELFVPH